MKPICTCDPFSFMPCNVCRIRGYMQTMLLSEGILLLDTETTGLDSNAEIIQISILDTNGNHVLSTYLQPQIEIDENGSAFAVNKITKAMVADAPTFRDLYTTLRSLLEKKIVIAYNAAFDRKMIEQEIRRNELEEFPITWDCAQGKYSEFVGEMDPKRPSQYRKHQLVKACSDMGVVSAPTHEAMADCLATLALMKAIATGV